MANDRDQSENKKNVESVTADNRTKTNVSLSLYDRQKSNTELRNGGADTHNHNTDDPIGELQNFGYRPAPVNQNIGSLYEDIEANNKKGDAPNHFSKFSMDTFKTLAILLTTKTDGFLITPTSIFVKVV